MNIDIINVIEKYGFWILLIILLFVGAVLLIKRIVEKTIDNIFSEELSKKSQYYISTLNRRTVAYEILLKKELEYYESISDFISELIVDIQDVLWNYEQFSKQKDDEIKEKYKKQAIKIYLKILKSIPVTKKDNLIFQNYSSKIVFKNHSEIICYLQKNIENINNIVLSEIESNLEDNINILTSITNETLMLSSKLMISIQEQQKELSK